MHYPMWAGALYYPYMRVRDENWLKAGALYWGSIRRFKPTSYRLRDSKVGRQLAEAGFLKSLDPDRYAADVSLDLLQFMKQNKRKYAKEVQRPNSSGLAQRTELGARGPQQEKQQTRLGSQSQDERRVRGLPL
jgi:hypothetical protein